MRISDWSSDVCSSDLSLEDAVAEADYVQESVFERVDVKHRISLAIGAAIRADAIVGSSSSGIPASEFTGDVQRRERFIIAHPEIGRASCRERVCQYV